MTCCRRLGISMRADLGMGEGSQRRAAFQDFKNVPLAVPRYSLFHYGADLRFG